jgi:hypothetical protein
MDAGVVEEVVEMPRRPGRSVRLLVAAMLVAAMAACTGRASTSTTAPATSTAPGSSATASPTPIPSPPTPATWRTIGPAPRWSDPETSVWDSTEVLSFGVRSLSGPPYCRYVATGFDPATDTWRELPPAPGPGGCFEGGDRAVWDGTEVLLWGVTNTAYNPATDRWRRLPDPPAGAGGPSVVVWTGTQMIGWGGGCCGGASDDGAAYTPRTNSWRLLPPSPLAARHAMGTWTGTELILAGGAGPESDPPTIYRDAAAYDPDTRTWRRLAAMPVPRLGGTMVWDGSEALVIGGGLRNGLQVERGVAYDPTTNRWRWLPPMAYPRFADAVVWAGDQVVVWGGLRTPTPAEIAKGHGWAGGPPLHGESFDPATGRWTALPRAPLRARAEPSAVWTGSEVVIWGGVDARAMNASPSKILLGGAALTPAST